MNERRRTLLFSKSNIPTENGVYIESVDHKFYLTDDWDTANTANSIAVVTDAHKFRISVSNYAKLRMDSYSAAPWEEYLSGTTNSGTTGYSSTAALADYSGAVNTQLIVTKCQSETTYAAGWCNAYTFPDGTTKGYLPACGELYLAYQNKEAINAALDKCGGTAFSTSNASDNFWSSTFYAWPLGEDRRCWAMSFYYGDAGTYLLIATKIVRPFAVLEDSN